ncbi:MAG: hypothetical protein Q7U04_04930, partial [Bacteriovorax sp.]|nr:hypothetical protein [Bacteriovorax sp.]
MLNSKYFLFFNKASEESRKEAQFTILLAAKKELIKFYEEKHEEKLLSISNIPIQSLKKVNETIKDTLENHMDKIFIRMQKNIQSEAGDSQTRTWDLFSDSVQESILKDVPVQTTL